MMNTKSKLSRAALRAALGAMGLMMVVSTGAQAADEEGSESTPTAAAGDDGGRDADTGSQAPPPPEVRERVEHGQVITEYTRRGGVYMMTVKPRLGPTQYWNDPDGDGQFQKSTSDDIDESLNLPKWRLGGW